MGLGKGLLIVGGTLACASVLASSPAMVVTSPLFWWGAKTYKLGAGAIAGIACGAACGAASGKIAGSTSSALIISGLDEVSQNLYQRMSGNVEEPQKE